MADGSTDRREARALIARASGALKVFPLPGVIVLPGTATPFHVFEPRYRAMTAAALEGDRTLAIATLVRDDEQPEDRPAVHPVAGAGVIESHERLPDGRYGILFRCQARVRLLSERKNGLPYREFQAEVLDDLLPPGGAAALASEVEVLVRLVYDLARLLPPESGAARLVEAATRVRDPGEAADLVAAAVAPEPGARLRVLETLDVKRRLAMVSEEVASVLLVLSRGRAPRA